MNVNVSSRCGVRASAGRSTVVVVSAAEVAAREAAFKAAYKATAEEAPLAAMLHETMYVSMHAENEGHRGLLARAEEALRKVLAELEGKHRPLYESAYEAGMRWGHLAEYQEALADHQGDQDNSWIRYACRGLRVLAWARAQGVYPELSDEEWSTYYQSLERASGGQG